MNPNTAVFVRALRNGKSSDEAMKEYCWAKFAVPIDERRLERFHERGGDPMNCPVAWGMSMADAKGADAFDAGASDEEIAAAFEEGLASDRERGVLWRAMREDEKPTAGQLVRAMSSEDRLKAAELLGVANVARMVLSR